MADQLVNRPIASIDSPVSFGKAQPAKRLSLCAQSLHLRSGLPPGRLFAGFFCARAQSLESPVRRRTSG